MQMQQHFHNVSEQSFNAFSHTLPQDPSLNFAGALQMQQPFQPMEPQLSMMMASQTPSLGRTFPNVFTGMPQFFPQQGQPLTNYLVVSQSPVANNLYDPNMLLTSNSRERTNLTSLIMPHAPLLGLQIVPETAGLGVGLPQMPLMQSNLQQNFNASMNMAPHVPQQEYEQLKRSHEYRRSATRSRTPDAVRDDQGSRRYPKSWNKNKQQPQGARRSKGHGNQHSECVQHTNIQDRDRNMVPTEIGSQGQRKTRGKGRSRRNRSRSNSRTRGAKNGLNNWEDVNSTKKNDYKCGYRTKQDKIEAVYQSLQKKYTQLGKLVSDDEVLRGEDTIRLHVKKFDALNTIESVMDTLDEHSRFELSKISIPMSMKNKFQKKGFLVYIKWKTADMAKEAKAMLRGFPEFKKCEIARANTSKSCVNTAAKHLGDSRTLPINAQTQNALALAAKMEKVKEPTNGKVLQLKPANFKVRGSVEVPKAKVTDSVEVRIMEKLAQQLARSTAI